jgi:AAA family ATP:ADP antiporter
LNPGIFLMSEHTAPRQKNLLERVLSLFAEVRSGEGALTLLMALNIFLILTAYLIAKVVREPLILASEGAEVKAYSSALQAIVLVVFLRIYTTMVGRFPRRRLINLVTLFFAACLVVFFFLVKAEVPVGVVYYVWVGVFSLMVIAQFWAFANDIYLPEEGSRLFVIIAFGASAGGVFGPMLASRLIDSLGIDALLLLSAGILTMSLGITNFVERRSGHRAERAQAQKDPSEPEEEMSKSGAFRVVFRNRYLLMIALMMLFTNWVNTTGEYVLGGVVEDAAVEAYQGPEGEARETAEKNFIGKFYSNFYFIVGLVGLLLQLFVVSRVIKYLGIRVAIMVLPLIALGGYIVIALYPVLRIMRWPKVAENATDYSLNNTVRHMLFLPTTREEKYKAKVAIDSFFVRAGDVLSALVVFVGVTYLAFDIRQFALFSVALVLVWLVLAYRIGLENRRLVAESGGGEG